MSLWYHLYSYSSAIIFQFERGYLVKSLLGLLARRDDSKLDHLLLQTLAHPQLDK